MSSFNAKLDNVSNFKEIFKALKNITDSINFVCTQDGINIQCLDREHASLITIKIKVNTFSLYNCPNAVSFGIKTNDLNQILKLFNNNEQLTLEFLDNINILHLIVNSNSKIFSFNIKILDVTNSICDIPNLNYNTKLSLISNEFIRIIEDFKVIDADTININVKDDLMEFTTENGSYQTTIALVNKEYGSNNSNFIVRHERPVQSYFGLIYIYNILPFATICDNVILFMGDNDEGMKLPLKLKFENDYCTIDFHLAPRFEDDGQN